ncbi:MAG: hypothetical protein A2007_03165 [Verrucomicrobia bacterium GWC2_42_7]|nr:MAG: hypothetical protein A2007_03165 [Verrucomicrobia bacterium GWC2_42_7]
MAEKEKEVKGAPEGPEEKEGAPAATEAAGASSLKNNPWLPTIVMLVLLPVLSFLMTEFILIPRVKKAIAVDREKEVASTSGENKEAKKGEKGGEKGKEGEKKIFSKSFTNIVANLSGSLQSRYIKVGFTIEGHDPEFEFIVQENAVKITDATLSLLSSVTINDLDEQNFKNVLRNDLLNTFETIFKKRVIEQLYFSEFVVQ